MPPTKDKFHIGKLRRKAGMTILGLAALARVSKSAIDRLENDPEVSPRLHTLEAVAKALNVTVVTLLSEQGSEFGVSGSKLKQAERRGAREFAKVLRGVLVKHGEDLRKAGGPVARMRLNDLNWCIGLLDGLVDDQLSKRELGSRFKVSGSKLLK